MKNELYLDFGLRNSDDLLVRWNRIVLFLIMTSALALHYKTRPIQIEQGFHNYFFLLSFTLLVHATIFFSRAKGAAACVKRSAPRTPQKSYINRSRKRFTRKKRPLERHKLDEFARRMLTSASPASSEASAPSAGFCFRSEAETGEGTKARRRKRVAILMPLTISHDGRKAEIQGRRAEKDGKGVARPKDRPAFDCRAVSTGLSLRGLRRDGQQRQRWRW
jgi:hypothetical protein